jgi:hypothetical protein
MPDKVLEGWQGKRPRAPPRGFSPDRTPNKGIQAYISVVAEKGDACVLPLVRGLFFLKIPLIIRKFFK